MKLIKELSEVLVYRQMLFSSVKKDLRSRYRGSFLGFLWTFINPIMQLVIYSIVFPYLLKMREGNYSLFIFIGLLPWIFLTSSLSISTTCVVGNGNLVKKIYFPRMILPISVSTTGLMNYIFGLLIVFLAIFFAGITLTPFVFILPLIILSQYIFVTGCCLILSALYVFFRDLEHIVGIVTMGWFYLTPIVFNITIFPERFIKFLMLNPMTQFIMAYRDVLLYGKAPDWTGFILVTIFSIGIFSFGVFLFSKLQKSFAEEI